MDTITQPLPKTSTTKDSRAVEPSAGDDSDVLYIVAPAYNVEETIRQFVEGWYPVVTRHPGNGKSRLTIVNDGSRDNTYARLMELKETRPCLTVLTRFPLRAHSRFCGYASSLFRMRPARLWACLFVCFRPVFPRLFLFFFRFCFLPVSVPYVF